MNSFAEVHKPETDEVGCPLVLLHGATVANWVWEPQLAALTDRLVLTPDLPGYGQRAAEDWPGVEAVADDMVARASGYGVDGPFDLVGLCLGAVVATRILARHPERVRSVLLTGGTHDPAGAGARLVYRIEKVLWRKSWFWRGQTIALKVPRESRERYVAHGQTVRLETALGVIADLQAHGVPADMGNYAGPLLAVAGAKDAADVRQSMASLTGPAPQSQLRLAPGMHHLWNMEDRSLFNDVLRAWLAGTVDSRLRPF